MKNSWTLVLLCWGLQWGTIPLAHAERASVQAGVEEERSFVPITRTASSDEYDYNGYDNDSPRPTSAALELLYPYFMDPNGAKPLALPSLNSGVQVDNTHKLPRGQLLDTRQQTCANPTYVVQCPQLDKPCCPVGYTVCPSSTWR